MKFTTLISVGIFSLITLVSCDFAKTNCIPADASMIQTIQFTNFTQQEVDSVILTSYEATSNYTYRLDSAVIHGIEYDSLRYYAATSLIHIDRDYKVRIKLTGQIYKISGFTTQKTVCNPSIFNKTYFNKLSGYTINGEKIINSEIEITRKWDSCLSSGLPAVHVSF